MAGGPVCWQSRQQTSVALSSMEAEYMALCATAQEAVWLASLLTDIGYTQAAPILIYEDNQSAIAYSKNNTDHKRTKHIDTKYHFVRERINDGLISLEYIGTLLNVADIFTKPLLSEPH